jgi:hypothetical protein
MVVLVLAEWVALESVRRGYPTDADNLAVMRILGVGALLLALPLVVSAAVELTEPPVTASRRSWAAGGVLVAVSGLAYGLFQLVAA